MDYGRCPFRPDRGSFRETRIGAPEDSQRVFERQAVALVGVCDACVPLVPGRDGWRHGVPSGHAGIRLGVLFAVRDGIRQSLPPDRPADVGDIMADIVGILMGMSLYCICRRRTSRRVRASAKP